MQDYFTDQELTDFGVRDKRHGQNRGGLWSYHLASADGTSAITGQ